MTGTHTWRSDLPAVEVGGTTVPAFALERVAELGEKPALVDGATGRTLGYRQLAAGVERVAAGLAARGFGKGEVLALASPNLPEYALAAYGAMAAGGVVTGANPLLTTGSSPTSWPTPAPACSSPSRPSPSGRSRRPGRRASRRCSSSARPTARPRSGSWSPTGTRR
jgi:non-ribosomal peptide synthetase component F